MTDENLLVDGAAIRRVRFTTILAHDESIPGALFRATSESVLAKATIVLAAAGIRGVEPGATELLNPEQIGRLAHVLRCDPNLLMRGRGMPIRKSGSSHHRSVAFGDLILPRYDLESVVRRISPLSLALSPHHRVSWLNKRLPYCPISREELIDTCPKCSMKLGWRNCWGMANCDFCDLPVPPSDAPLLADEHVENYRLYALLTSPIAAERASVIDRLPLELRSQPPRNLLLLARRLGTLIYAVENGIKMPDERSLQPPAIAAAILSSGFKQLRTWPAGFRIWAYAHAERVRPSRELYGRLRERLLAISKDFPTVIAAALPDLHSGYSHSFASAGTYYLHHEAYRRIGIKSQYLRLLSEQGIVPATLLPSPGKKRLVRYEKTMIDGFATTFRSSTGIGNPADLFDLPRYGIEDLINHELLVEEHCPVAWFIRQRISITRASIQLLIERLNKVSRNSRAPDDAITIKAASRRIGGRPKPWAAMLKAILDGRLPIWSDGRDFNAFRWRVRPADMVQFDDIECNGRLRVLSEGQMHLCDVEEILNLSASYSNKVLAWFVVPVEHRGARKRCNVTAVLDISRQFVSSAEIGQRHRLTPAGTRGLMARHGAKALGTGWCRKDAEAKGLLD